MPGPPDIDIRDISFKLRYITRVSQSFSRIYARFGNSPCICVCSGESLSLWIGYWQKYMCKKHPVWYHWPRWHLVGKKNRYIIVLWWNIMPWFNLGRCATQHLYHCKTTQVGMWLLRLQSLDSLICLCIAEKFVIIIMRFSIFTLAEGPKKNPSL